MLLHAWLSPFALCAAEMAPSFTRLRTAIAVALLAQPTFALVAHRAPPVRTGRASAAYQALITIPPAPAGRRTLPPRCQQPSSSPPQQQQPSAGALILSPEVSIGVGLALLLILVFNRLFTEELLNSQSRADLIATIGPTVLVLEGLTRLDITPREAEPVPLDGRDVAWVASGLAPALQRQLEWSVEAAMTALPTSSLAVWYGGETVALRGKLAEGVAAGGAEAYARAVVPGPLLRKASESKSGAPDYLPSLQVLPGRVEFSYLPAATQAVLLVPLPGQGALILGADRQRAFREDDVAWARQLAAGLAASGA